MRIAFVGCGYVAEQYLATLKSHKELELVGVMDRDPVRAERFAAHYRVPARATLAEVVGDSRVEIVVNLTNPGSHAEVTEASLRAGKHVYSEKPLAMSAADAARLVSLADERGLYLSGAPSRLLGEPAQTMWKVLRDGSIGRPRLAYAELDDGLLHTMDFRDWKGPSGAPWPYRDELETGCTIEHAGYALTWLLAFFGPAQSVTAYSSLLVPDKDIVDVSADAMAPDFSVAVIQFASGVHARLTNSIVAPEDHRIRIAGDLGVLSVDNCWKPDSAIRLERIVVNGRWQPSAESVVIPQLRDPNLPDPSRSSKKVDFCLGLRELVSAIEQRRPSRLSARFCLHVTEVTLAIHGARGGEARIPIRSSFDPIAPMDWATSPTGSRKPEAARGHRSIRQRIWAIHGVIDRVDASRFAHRNLDTIAELDEHLSSCPPYVSLAAALAGDGEALTIDDATRAGADAARLARARGHAVTLFVNPGQIESGQPYHFVVLNSLLDALHGEPYVFEGTSYSTATNAQRQTLRRAVKARLVSIKGEVERLDFVRALGEACGLTDLNVPSHFQTLNKADLIGLRDAGVDLQNHGWSHSHHPGLSPAESRQEIADGRRWLEAELGIQAPYFAVPFGDALPQGDASTACDIWFSLDDAIAPGRHPPNVFNRETLDLRPRPERSSSRWTGRLSRWLWTQKT